MAYTSPTTIYKQNLSNGFVLVTDVSGTFAVQIYLEGSNGYTTLAHSETWSDSLKAIECADRVRDAAVSDWWNNVTEIAS